MKILLFPLTLSVQSVGLEIRRELNIAWCVTGTLQETILFMEDDPFDLEVTKDFLIEYRKNFWGTRRTGKIEKYSWDKMENVQFGSPVTRFIFNHDGKRVVLPLREENMELIKKLFNE